MALAKKKRKFTKDNWERLKQTAQSKDKKVTITINLTASPFMNNGTNSADWDLMRMQNKKDDHHA